MRDERKDVLAVIPARYAAQRFPGKPLAKIAGKPMIQWVWEGVHAARRVSRVVVATDDQRIVDVVQGFGGEAQLTSPDCASGTDRVAEVAKTSRAGIVLNVQGDEPLITSQAINRVVEVLQKNPQASMSTVVRPADSEEEWEDPNTVKAVFDRDGNALYFSRAPIPVQRDPKDLLRAPRWIHLGLYGFRRAFLFRFASLAPTPLEQSEKLEQLRVLENGSQIKVVTAMGMTSAVDVPRDIKKVERILSRKG